MYSCSIFEAFEFLNNLSYPGSQHLQKIFLLFTSFWTEIGPFIYIYIERERERERESRH